ncbi:multiple epidermal growth factor-like domains 10 [Elysia marginata]|uniref:Multiple epidermal growth factor-like domains 10 n=1 Tax=Elysia marginata TaxID=1093978 RepID=A0AAV4HVY2_9GAST|nr:multiple epidermal growth factor-like domains 10 [Elysia marginata]
MLDKVTKWSYCLTVIIIITAAFFAGLAGPSKVYTVKRKEHKVLQMTCPSDRLISLQSAIYSFYKPSRFPHCKRYTSVIHKIRRDVKCIKQSNCKFIASNTLLGDVCRGAHKFLTVQYTCKRVCPFDYFGPGCGKVCSKLCAKPSNLSTCHAITGACLDGCFAGYTGDYCDMMCSNQTYGYKCTKDCSRNCKYGKGRICDNVNGTCFYSCINGYTGLKCDIIAFIGDNIFHCIWPPAVFFFALATMAATYVSRTDKGIQKRKEESRSKKAAQQKRHGGKKKVKRLRKRRRKKTKTKPKPRKELRWSDNEEGPKPSLKKPKDYIVSVFRLTKPRKFFRHRKSRGVFSWSGTPESDTLESGTDKPPSVAGASTISTGQASTTLLNERDSVGLSRSSRAYKSSKGSLNTIVSYPAAASRTSKETVVY